MFEKYINEIKKLMSEQKLWKDEYTVLPNSKNGGQSLCFFIRNASGKPIFIAKYFNYLNYMNNITELIGIKDCKDVDEYLDLLAESQIPYDLDQINELAYYLKRSFSRYVEVALKTENLFPKVFCYNDNIKLGNTFYGLLIEEAVDGITLKEKMNNVIMDGFDNVHLAIKCLKEIGIAVSNLWNNGYVHRDLSPDNIMVSHNNQIIIIDPGTIKIVNRDTTNFGYIMGKKHYASPEQYRGEAVAANFSSDLYSIGIIAYQIVTGTNLLESYIRRSEVKPHELICKDLDRSIEDEFFSFCDDDAENNIILYGILKKLLQVDRDFRFANIESYTSAVEILKEVKKND